MSSLINNIHRLSLFHCVRPRSHQSPGYGITQLNSSPYSNFRDFTTSYSLASPSSSNHLMLLPTINCCCKLYLLHCHCSKEHAFAPFLFLAHQYTHICTHIAGMFRLVSSLLQWLTNFEGLCLILWSLFIVNTLGTKIFECS